MLKLSVPRDFSVAELAKETGLTESTIRYYIKEVLQDYLADHAIGVKGKTKRHSARVLERLQFIKRVKQELETASGRRIEPTIVELRRWMSRISDQQVSAVLRGDDTLEFAVTRVEDGVRIIETVKGEVLPEDSLKYGAHIESTTDPVWSKSAASYANSTMGAHKLDKYASHLPLSQWQHENFGTDLQIRYRRQLTNKQLEQLRAAGNLLRLILGEEES